MRQGVTEAGQCYGRGGRNPDDFHASYFSERLKPHLINDPAVWSWPVYGADKR